jgi:hypothetical protein
MIKTRIASSWQEMHARIFGIDPVLSVPSIERKLRWDDYRATFRAGARGIGDAGRDEADDEERRGTGGASWRRNC